MYRTMRVVLFGSAVSVFALAAQPVAAGPPWISVEYPANPHDRSTRDAMFLVHAYHHGDHIRPEIRATLEGLIDGQRRTIEARIAETGRPGVYAVYADRPADGTWIAVVRLRADRAPATALVTLGEGAVVSAVDVPVLRQDGWKVPRDVSEAEIIAALRTADALASGADGTGARAPANATDSPDGDPAGIAFAAALLAIVAGGSGVIRRRHE